MSIWRYLYLRFIKGAEFYSSCDLPYKEDYGVKLYFYKIKDQVTIYDEEPITPPQQRGLIDDNIKRNAHI